MLREKERRKGKEELKFYYRVKIIRIGSGLKKTIGIYAFKTNGNSLTSQQSPHKAQIQDKASVAGDGTMLKKKTLFDIQAPGNS